MSIQDVIDERDKQYGGFINNACTSQSLKEVLYSAIDNNENHFSKVQLEALEMIAHKLARIVNGDPDYIDSWVDIQGYANLAIDLINPAELILNEEEEELLTEAEREALREVMY